MIFTNLHYVHNYYQTSIAVFILIPVGLGIAALYEKGSKLVATVAFILVLGSETIFNLTHTIPAAAADRRGDQEYRIALVASEQTSEDQALVVFGVDWASQVHYYAKRKGYAVANWIPSNVVTSIMNSDGLIGGLTVGGVIVCGETLTGEPERLSRYYLQGRIALGKVGSCRFFK